MTVITGSDLYAFLRRRLAGSSRIAVIGIGDELSVVDRLGMAAARELASLDLPGTTFFFAGTVPEGVTGPVRRLLPDHILFLDSAEMGIRPGTAAVIPSGAIRPKHHLTHSLPLSVVIEYLEHETGAPVILLGIQPDMAWMTRPMSDEERAVLNATVAGLAKILWDAGKTRRV